MLYGLSQVGYLVASVCFIFALHWMNTPATARKGVYAGVAGTAIAILVTWADPTVVHHLWIIGAIAAGFLVGVPLSRVPLTAVPQRTALSHAFGGLAAGLVGTAEYYLQAGRGRGAADDVSDGRAHRRGPARLSDVHRQPDGRRQAAGSEVDSAAAGHLSDAERDQPAAVRVALALAGGARAPSDRGVGAAGLSRSSSCCRCCSACC